MKIKRHDRTLLFVPVRAVSCILCPDSRYLLPAHEWGCGLLSIMTHIGTTVMSLRRTRYHTMIGHISKNTVPTEYLMMSAHMRMHHGVVKRCKSKTVYLSQWCIVFLGLVCAGLYHILWNVYTRISNVILRQTSQGEICLSPVVLFDSCSILARGQLIYNAGEKYIAVIPQTKRPKTLIRWLGLSQPVAGGGGSLSIW